MTKERLTKKILFWIGAVLAIVVVLGVLAALVVLNWPKAPPEPEEITYPPPEETVLLPEDFQYDESGFLTCTAAPTVLGIDVSQYQGDVDWEQVRAAGVEFVMIRVGGRGYGQKGGLYTDDMAPVYYEGAKAAGLKVGVYFFSQAITPEEAQEEAEMTLQIVSDWQLDMPIVYDWEVVEAENSRTLNVAPRVITDCMKAFCRVIQANGRRAMIYFNPDISLGQIYIDEISIYDFWLAYYTDWNNYPYKVDMWQYTNQGTVPGIEGNVDINLYFPEAE